MPRGIWKGDINFGLVYIPVTLYSAESHHCEVKMHLLDKRDLSPVGYTKINKNTGEKVPAEQLVEGYEYEDKSYVVLTKEEIKKIQPPSTQSIEILEFVDEKDIQPEYFEKPYFLEPIKKGNRGYALLREALKKTGKVGIARVVIRTRQYLAALIPEGKAIMLELMHFPCELLSADEFNLPDTNLAKLKIQKKELAIAEELIKSMSTKWSPEKYENEYSGDLLDYVMEKIKLGKAVSVQETKVQAAPEKKGQVIDLMALLKKSVANAKKPPAKTRVQKPRRKAAKK